MTNISKVCLTFIIILLPSVFLLGQPDNLKLNKVPPVSSVFQGSNFIDFYPIVSPDGHMILFTRAGHPDNYGGVSDPGDIWCIKKQFNGNWGHPHHLGRSINNAGLNYVAGMDVDSKTIYLNNTYNLKDSTKTLLYYSNYRNGIFTAPHLMDLPGIDKYPPPIMLTAASSNKYLIISLSSSLTDRRENLYISYNADGQWTNPVLMNDEINSNEREIFPYMPNDSCLYFSSNGLAGYGGMDGYYTQRQSIDWQTITLPYNLGPKLNSSGEETNVSVSKDLDLFYSQETRSGNSTTIRQTKGILPEFEIMGSINSDKGKPISGKVELHDLNDYSNELSIGTNNLGRFSVKIHQKTGIKAIAHAAGYLPQIIITSENQLNNESPLEIDFQLKKIILGQSIHLNEVAFSEDGRDLIQSSVLQLEIIAEALQQNSEIRAIISLYAHHLDDVQENKRILDIETKLIRNLLEAKGARMNNLLFVSHPKLPKDFQSETGFGSYVEIVFVKN